MAVLVTGGTGLIGSNVVRRLAGEGDSVVVLDRVGPAQTGSPLSDATGEIVYVNGTVTDLALLAQTIKKHRIDSVVHLAAIVATNANLRPLEALEVNIIGSANVLEAARIFDLRRVLLMSSSAVMGAPDDLETPRAEEDLVLPATGIYPLSKLAIEQMAHTYRQLYGVDCTSIRPRTVYGPGTPQYHHPMPVSAVVGQACRGEDIVLATGSDTPFDLTYVKDEAQGIIKALRHDKPLAYHVYNISYGRNVTMGSVLAVLTQLFPRLRIEVGPGLWEGILARGSQTDLTYRSSQRPPQDITKAREDFGYEPVWPVERAIPDYVRWLQAGTYGTFD